MSAETDTAMLIAAYNAEATLDRAIASALAQPEIVEVCVIDDCSKDGTLEIAQRWAAREKRVIAIGLTVNGGPAAARNVGLAATKAPWIGILDADDYLLEGRTAKMHAAAQGADFIADVLLRAREGEAPRAPEWDAGEGRDVSFAEFVEGNLGRADRPLDLGFIKPLMRRAFLENNGLTYRAEMRLGEDYDIYARALALGARLILMAPAGYVSVEREGSLSRTHSELDLQRLRDCDAEIAALRVFTPAEKRALARHWTSVDQRLQWRRLITAVKMKNAGAALSTFHTPAAAMYLGARLAEQAWLRGPAKLAGRAAS